MIRLDRIGARQAIWEAYAIHLTSKGFDVLDQVVSTKTASNGSLICNAAQAGKVIAVIERLPEHLRAWAVWAYGPRTKTFGLSAQGAFFEWLIQDVTIRLLESDRQYREATANKIRDVVAYTVMDYRHKVTTGLHLHPVSDIKKRCGIQHGNWKRDFVEWYDDYREVCNQLDRKVLLPLSNVLLEERRKSERYYCRGVYAGPGYVKAGLIEA